MVRRRSNELDAEGEVVTFLTIGAFAERTRLSPKALRIYDDLGLVVPAQVDPNSGYRLYEESQVEHARFVGLLRRLDMPLADIARVLDLDGADAAAALVQWWSELDTANVERRALVQYLHSRLLGEEPPMKAVEIRTLPARKILSISRHVTSAKTDAFFHDAFHRLRAAAPGLQGIEGAPFLIFYGEVSDDSDGPVELCRPLAFDTPDDVVDPSSDLQLRVESSHDEAFLRLQKSEMSWPAMLPFCDALYQWTRDHHRRPAGSLRQLLIADQRTAEPTTLVCDLSLPLH